ncbi:MAG: N-acetyltransferase, partial [Anaerolineaceae bacterium]|nr:N-acetyltransferase [Anaerolineaceae bacterium]
MKFELPTKASQEVLEIDAREVEAMLQGPKLNIPAFPEAMLKLKDGRTLYIREAKVEEVPAMLTYMEKLMKVDHDFYDIVGSRVYSEILGWKRKRLKDPYTLVGLIDGVWAGFANGRLMNEDINISLHTMALIRGGRIGAAMYYAKAYYGF